LHPRPAGSLAGGNLVVTTASPAKTECRAQLSRPPLQSSVDPQPPRTRHRGKRVDVCWSEESRDRAGNAPQRLSTPEVPTGLADRTPKTPPPARRHRCRFRGPSTLERSLQGFGRSTRASGTRRAGASLNVRAVGNSAHDLQLGMTTVHSQPLAAAAHRALPRVGLRRERDRPSRIQSSSKNPRGKVIRRFAAPLLNISSRNCCSVAELDGNQ
jgi:hypothetical protein